MNTNQIIDSVVTEGNPILTNSNITPSFWEDILEGLDEKGASIPFKNINLYEINNSTLLLEYSNITDRNNTMNELQNNIIMKNTFMSEGLENGRQVPGTNGTFEKDGKYFLIIRSYLKNTDEINTEKGIYKGNIICPELYYNQGEQVSSQSINTNNKVIDLIS